MSLLDDALGLSESGLAVFPCGPDKRPLTPHGFKDATTDPETILNWTPEWVNGALVGAAITPGLIVVDVDPRNGGDATIDALLKADRRLSVTRLVKTRSGGTHRYYTVPPDVELRSTLGPGVDIKRAGKGYVIVPPSDGYTLAIDIEPRPAPEWLLEELRVEGRQTPTSGASDPRFWASFEKGSPYGLAGLERELGRLATQEEGGRNQALNKAAFSAAQLAAGGELDEEHARAELERVALLIGLEPEEIAGTLDSGWRAGEQDPRSAPALDSERTTPDVAAVALEPGDPEAEGRFWLDWDDDAPGPAFYAYPLLPRNACVLVYGATEAAKSMSWLGLLAEGSHHGVRSSVYSLENPPTTDRHRLKRWSPSRENFRLTNQPLDFNDPRQVEALIRREKEWGANVVFIDTYSMAFHSMSDDGNGKAIQFYRRVRLVMHEVGCSVVVVDHTGFQGELPRDASAKLQQVDMGVFMEKSGEWELGRAARFTMRNMKTARFANPFRMAGEIRDVKDGGLELGWASDVVPEWRTV